jgi:hypothetical protein
MTTLILLVALAPGADVDVSTLLALNTTAHKHKSAMAQELASRAEKPSAPTPAKAVPRKASKPAAKHPNEPACTPYCTCGCNTGEPCGCTTIIGEVAEPTHIIRYMGAEHGRMMIPLHVSPVPQYSAPAPQVQHPAPQAMRQTYSQPARTYRAPARSSGGC